MNRYQRLFLMAAIFTHSCVQAQQDEARLSPPPMTPPDISSNTIMESWPEHLLYMYTQSREPDGVVPVSNQLYGNDRKWENGRILKVCLFGGNRTVAKLIRDVAGEWNQYSAVKFDFGPQNGWYNCLAPVAGFFQIRIGFSEKGYWSAVGNDAERLLIPLQPSMNLESFNTAYSDMRMSPDAAMSMAQPYDLYVIRHEFGHALGLLHEHQNPALDCPKKIRWTGPGNVYEVYGRPPNNWKPLQVDRNFGSVAKTDADARAGKWDAKSVMRYATSREIYVDPNSPCAGGINYVLSDLDKKIVAEIYPASTAEQPRSAGELDIKSANLSSLPSTAAAPIREDHLERVSVDLESPDKFVRRDARAQLAGLIQKNLSPGEITELTQQMNRGSYRVQLGIAVALAQAKVRLTPAARASLAQKASATNDPTLKKYLKQVLK